MVFAVDGRRHLSCDIYGVQRLDICGCSSSGGGVVVVVWPTGSNRRVKSCK